MPQRDHPDCIIPIGVTMILTPSGSETLAHVETTEKLRRSSSI